VPWLVGTEFALPEPRLDKGLFQIPMPLRVHTERREFWFVCEEESPGELWPKASLAVCEEHALGRRFGNDPVGVALARHAVIPVALLVPGRDEETL